MAQCPWPLMPAFMLPMFGMMSGKAGPSSLVHKNAAAAAPLPGMPPKQATKQAGAAKPGAVKTAATASAQAAPAAKPTAQDDDEDLVCLKPDEEVTLEPGELEVFEKVAAMERDKQSCQQQQQFERACSPSGSCLTAVTGGNSGSPRSPMSSMQQPPVPFPLPGMPCLPFPPGFPCMPLGPMPGCFGMPFPGQALQQPLPFPGAQAQQKQQKQPKQQQWQWQKQAQQLWKPQAPSQQQQGAQDAAPVPWSSFAADDCGDDLDRDLQEIIVLPKDCMQAPNSAAAAPGACAAGAKSGALAAAAACEPNSLSQGPAAAAKARSGSSSLRRVGSTASAYSSFDAYGAPAAAAPRGSSGSGSGSKATQRVLRIRNIRGTAADSTPAAGAGRVTRSKIVLKGSTAKRSSGSNSQQAPSGPLGVHKGGVQKRVTIDTSKNSISGGSSGSGSKAMPAVHAVPQHKPQVQPQQEDASLSLLGDMDSSLSAGDALTAGIAPMQDCWDALMQEASDDGWDGLLGTTDIGLVDAPGL